MDAGQPQQHVFPEGDDVGTLVRNVRDAVSALPVYFRTATRIEGLDGGELFNLSAVLGSAIEVQVVETLKGTQLPIHRDAVGLCSARLAGCRSLAPQETSCPVSLSSMSLTSNRPRYVAEFRNWWWTNIRETSDTLNQRQVNPPNEEVFEFPDDVRAGIDRSSLLTARQGLPAWLGRNTRAGVCGDEVPDRRCRPPVSRHPRPPVPPRGSS